MLLPSSQRETDLPAHWERCRGSAVSSMHPSKSHSTWGRRQSLLHAAESFSVPKVMAGDSHVVRGSTTGVGDMGRCHFLEEYDTPLVPPAFQPASDLAMAHQTENGDQSKNCSTLLGKSSLWRANQCINFFLDIMKPWTGRQLFTS